MSITKASHLLVFIPLFLYFLMYRNIIIYNIDDDNVII